MTGATHQRLHFGLALLVLLVSAGLMQDARNRGWLRVIKKPLSIRKPLSDMDRGCLSPFRYVVSRRLPAETEAELGTEEYINWVLDLPEASKPWSGRVALAVTYYTDAQDQVPHVSEECMLQGGFSPGEDDTLEMEFFDDPKQTIRVRRLSFLPPRRAGSRMYVYYVICVNNEFFPGRMGARLRMKNDRDSHLFYSKAEVSFDYVSRDRLSELDEYARMLLDRALTELTASHWPLKGWERGGPPAEPGGIMTGSGVTDAPWSRALAHGTEAFAVEDVRRNSD